MRGKKHRPTALLEFDLKGCLFFPSYNHRPHKIENARQHLKDSPNPSKALPLHTPQIHPHAVCGSGGGRSSTKSRSRVKELTLKQTYCRENPAVPFAFKDSMIR